MTVAPCIDPWLPARPLSPAECRDCLLRRHEGRLAYSTGRGPRCVVDRVVDHDDEIVLRVPEFNEICQYAPGCEVCLVIDELVGAGSEWVEVTASGWLRWSTTVNTPAGNGTTWTRSGLPESRPRLVASPSPSCTPGRGQAPPPPHWS